VILGGQGGVGQLFAELLGDEGKVTLVDLRASTPPSGTFAMVADACRPSPQLIAELADADVVIVALPEEVGAAAIEAAAAHLPRGALIAETLSVKSTIAGPLATAAERHGLEALGVNPMFAPDLGFPGRPVLVSEVRGGSRCRRLGMLIEERGGRLVRISIPEHDRLTASLQVATHASLLAFGLASKALGADVATLVAAAPPPHRTLLALLARIITGTPEVYRDIQAAHPYAHEARRAVSDAITQLDDAATSTSAARFEEILAELAEWLGPERERLAGDCAELFAHLTDIVVLEPTDDMTARPFCTPP
jgi:prephenate dehydrogenase